MGCTTESYTWASELAPSDLEAVVAIFGAGWLEWNPRQHPISVPAYVDADRMSAPPQRVVKLLARAEGEVVGIGQAQWRDGEPGACLARIFVSAAHRRRGVAQSLLDALVAAVQEHGRVGITLETVEGSPLGPALERRGFAPDLVVEQNWTDPRTIDADLLTAWVARGEAAAGYRLVAYDAPCPDDLAEDFVHARFIMNDAPRREGEPEARFDVGELRAVEAAVEAADHRWWNVGIRHEASGELVGFSEIYFSHKWPTMAYQGDTGVAPAHRGHGLGAWMKAVNHVRLQRERPDVAVVSTWNANSNAPMLRINHLLGFRAVQTYRSWYLPFG